MTQAHEDLDLKKMLEDSYKARQDLQLSIEATTEQLSENLKEQRQSLEKALADRAAALEQTLCISSEIDNLKHENERIRGLIDEKDSAINTLKPKAASAATFETQLSTVSKELEKAIVENSDLEKKLQDSINAFGNSNATMNKRVQDLTNEKAQLMNKIEELAKTNNALKQENDRYANLTNELLAQIALLQAEVQAAKARENREKHLLKMLKEEEEAKAAIKKELDVLAKKFAEQTEKLIKDNKRITEEKNISDSEVLRLKKKSEEQEKSILGFSKDLEKARSEVIGLEQQIKVLGDQRHMIEQLTLQNADYERKNQSLSEQLKDAEATIEEQDETIRSQSEKITELEAIRAEREEQLLSLENIIDELRKDREVYKPTKDDPIDIALSDYVNTRPAGMKVQFEREDHGIYNFGTKKIFVKLEQGKLLIRVGGGYMQVEDFVKMYSPVELERFSTLKKEQAQKIRQSYLGKYADKLAVSKPSGQSPERASKLLKDQMAAGNYTTYYAVQARSPERASIDRSPVGSERNSRLSN
jgi:chromosome segregation ATPase